MTSLYNVTGIGSIVLEVFKRTKYYTTCDLVYADTKRIKESIDEMQYIYPNYPPTYWRRLLSRCQSIIYRLKSDYAQPFIPDFFMCPLTLDWFTDPVVTRYGTTYDSEPLSEWVSAYQSDPITNKPLSPNDIFPNHIILRAQETYRLNQNSFKEVKNRK